MIEPFEKNGIRVNERVCVIDVPHVLGTVTECSPDAVTVQWDDGLKGDLVWREDVAYNAYRLQIVRRAIAEGSALPPVSSSAAASPAQKEKTQSDSITSKRAET